MVSELNRRLVFTARTSTDLRIIPWISLRIAYVSGPQRARIRIGSGSPATVQISPNESEILQHATNELTQTYPRTRIHPTIYTHKHTCTPAYIRIQVYIYIHLYTYIYIHIRTWIKIHRHAHPSCNIHNNTQTPTLIWTTLLHKCPYKNKNKTNLEPICGAPTGAPTESSGVAEGVVG